MPRTRHSKIDDMPEAVQILIRHGIERNSRQVDVIAEVKAQTGVDLDFKVLNRYWTREAAKLREQERQDREVRVSIQSGVEKCHELDLEMTEAARARFLEQVHKSVVSGEMTKMPPFSAGLLAAKFIELDRKERELAERKRTNDLAEGKLKLLEAKRQAIEDRVLKAKECVALNPEEAAKQLDEIYGLTKN